MTLLNFTLGGAIMPQKNCIVAQSGGPTVAINASLAGVVRGILDSNEFDTCYGSIHGITGVWNNTFLNLTEAAQEEGFLDSLRLTPAMYLGSCRHKLPSVDADPEIYEKIRRHSADGYCFSYGKSYASCSSACYGHGCSTFYLSGKYKHTVLPRIFGYRSWLRVLF